MATLPRTSSNKHKANVSFPFSSSPRKLHEMTLPDGNGDLTCASGVSIKQYEEQLNSLKKENFHLKLRIYFLEEKLGSGAPPAVQGLLEHNVRLQVQAEELRRQLSDKQQLLAAAAHAIDVIEHQGSISLDSDMSLNGDSALRRKVLNLEQSQEDKPFDTDVKPLETDVKPLDTDVKPFDADVQAVINCPDITTDGLSSTPEQDEIFKVKQENYKALQMIQGCIKRIQQQEKQIKKLKQETEQVSEPQVDRYEEILRCKNEHIQDLEQRLREAQKNMSSQADEQSAGNLQELLRRRLQALAYFLDKLLMHKCVLGEDKKKLAESLLEQSLALPIGLKLDESLAPEDFSIDESTLDISHTLRMEDLTLMFGHHGLCEDGGRQSRVRAAAAGAGLASESECWSEPDRQVSLARIGLGDTAGAAGPRASAGSGGDERRRSGRRPRTSDLTLHDELQRLRAHAAALVAGETELKRQLGEAHAHIEVLDRQVTELTERARAEAERAESCRGEAERLRLQAEAERGRRGEAEARAAAAADRLDRLRAERLELETNFAETERTLRRAADEAALQASQAALDRTRAQHERLRLERELEEARTRLAAAAPTPAAPPADHDRCTSPDQGIDSDRLSSLEIADAASLSPRSLYEENTTLKQKLARTKATLAETLTQLNAANMRKMSVQRAICREIHKTHGVLRKARDQFENN